MYTRRQNTQHPFAHATLSRIDLYYEGRQDEVIDDSFTIIRQALPELAAGDHLLYLNTLASPNQLARVTDKISERHLGKVLTFSASGSVLMQKLDMLSKLVVAKKVKIIILNSIDLAVNGPRQKLALVQWLREMRDGHDVRVAVYSMGKASEMGAMALLKWLADRYEPAGEWKWEHPQSLGSGSRNSNAALRDIEAKLDTGSLEEPAEILTGSGGPTKFQIYSIGDLLATASLKNKELDGVGASSGEGNSKFKIENSKLGEVEELELAMAA